MSICLQALAQCTTKKSVRADHEEVHRAASSGTAHIAPSLILMADAAAPTTR
jgi:hypothetical protein